MEGIDLLLEEYELLEESKEKELFEISALCMMPINSGRLLELAKDIGMRSTSGGPVNAASLSNIKKIFIELGLWQNQENPNSYSSNTEYVGLPTALNEALFEKLAQADSFYQHIKTIRKIFPFQQRYPFYENAFYIARRELYLAFYLDDFGSMEEMIDYIMKYLSDQETEEDLFTSLFTTPFQDEKILKLGHDTQVMILGRLILGAVDELADLSEYQRFLENLPESLSTTQKRRYRPYLAIIYLVQGNLKEIEKFVQDKSPINFIEPAIQAWMLLVMGYPAASVKKYEEAIKLMRKTVGESSVYFENVLGTFFPFAVFKADLRRKFKTLISLCKKTTYWQQQNVDDAVQAVIYARQNDFVSARSFLFQPSRKAFPMLLYGWASLWVDLEMIKPETIGLMERHCETALKNGHKWYVLEMSAFLAKINRSRNGQAHYENQAHELRNELGLQAFIDGIEPEEKWEIALDALTQIGGTKKKVTSGQDSRLIWLVDFEKERLQPKEQKLSKNGKWSAGRNVSLKRLFEGDVKSLTEHDQRITKTIEPYSHGYYGSVEYEINTVKAFYQMVGHPLLFLWNSTGIAVELVREEPQFVLEEKEDGFELRLENLASQEGSPIQRETPTRYKLHEFNETHESVIQAMGGNRLKIPAKGKDQLLALIGNLSTLIPIHSTIEGTNQHLKQIPSDPLPRMHVLPVGDSFRMEMLVKPFQTSPPYFHPGEGRAQILAEIEGEQAQTSRDLVLEKEKGEAIIEACSDLKYLNAHTWEWFLEDTEECLDVLLQLNPLREKGDIILEWPKGEQFSISRSALDFGDMQMQIKRKNNWFELKGELKINEKEVWSFQELLRKTAESNNQFIEVTDGQFVALTEELRKKLKEWESLSLSHGGIQRIHPLQAAGFQELDDLIPGFTSDTAWKDAIHSLHEAWQKTFVLPSTFKAELRPYQEEGYQWLQRLAHWGGGACLADDMGLGKTIQALALLLERAEKGPSLVVAPASVVRNWRAEVTRFCPTLNPIIFGPGDRQKQIEELKPFDLLLCSYGLLPPEEELLCGVSFNVIILDEAQAIKNSATKRSRVAMKLNAGFRMALTGTPIENHLGELWNLFEFINPGLLGTNKSFTDRFLVPIERDNDLDKKKHLKKLIQPFILRRRKSEVLDDLPAKTEISLTIDLSEEEIAFYEAMRRDAVMKIETENEVGQNNMRVLAEIMRLRQASCHPALVNPEINISASKMETLGKLLDELIENGHKALIFSQFVGHLKLIQAFIEKRNINYQYLDGQTSLNKREARINAFQRGEGDVFLISLKAGGTGLNLTAADYVIHMDPWWNPAVEDQASDRAHRIGQKRPVTVYRLIAANTIEEKIVKLHERKRGLADSLLEGTEVSARLTASELVALIKDN